MLKLFAALDKNQDNKISAEEFVNFLTKSMGRKANVETAKQRIKSMDQGAKDGCLDEKELTDACAGMTTDEIETMMEKLGERPWEDWAKA